MGLIKLAKGVYWSIRYPVKHRFFGIHMFLGLPGEGKTLSMTNYLNETYDLLVKAEKDFEIYTNYFYVNETAPLRDWKHLVEIAEDKKDNSEKITLIAIDEVNTVFNSREWKNFPIEIMTMLAQSRHMNIQILCTAQIYDHVEKVFRDLVNYVYQCRRLNSYYFYHWKYDNADYRDGRVKGGFMRMDDVLLDERLRNSYDTFAFVNQLKNKEYSERVNDGDITVRYIDGRSRKTK